MSAAPETRKERLARQTLQELKRIEAWLAWFCLGVRPGSVTDRERQRNRAQELLEAAVVRLSAQAGLPHPHDRSWLIALLVIAVWGLKICQVVMNRRRRKLWRDVWR